MTDFSSIASGLALGLAAAAVAAALVVSLRPLLVRYALARPNARSAHQVPTPQGGGIAVLGAALLASGCGAAVMALPGPETWRLVVVGAAAVLIGLLGAVDDIRPLPPLPRLGCQLVAVGVMVAALPEGARILPLLPAWIETLVLVLGGTWFVNLVNFMDGMDWMTVVEVVPLTGALALFWAAGFLSTPAGLLSLGLCGGLAGFAPFNRPVARLFLGDVGSLPIGLVVAYGLFDLAVHGGLAAAVLLPLYYIADSGITLVWRLRRRHRVWEAHRWHFYQVATARGFTVRQVLARVVLVNVALAVFAAASLLQTSAALVLADVGLGAALVAKLLRDLARGRPANLNTPR